MPSALEIKLRKMFKLLIAAFMCLCLASQISAAKNETKGVFLQDPHYHGHGHQYGVGYYGWSYPYSDYYYAWYNRYPNYFAVDAHHAAECSHICPHSCHGTCGLWSNLYACEYQSCAKMGNPCTAYNIHRGNYLHVHPFSQHRYIQCDVQPGRQFVRTCPSGLVFDPRFSVCNYPVGVVQFYNDYVSHLQYDH